MGSPTPDRAPRPGLAARGWAFIARWRRWSAVVLGVVAIAAIVLGILAASDDGDDESTVDRVTAVVADSPFGTSAVELGFIGADSTS